MVLLSTYRALVLLESQSFSVAYFQISPLFIRKENQLPVVRPSSVAGGGCQAELLQDYSVCELEHLHGMKLFWGGKCPVQIYCVRQIVSLLPAVC
jgi:hypothetical protein